MKNFTTKIDLRELWVHIGLAFLPVSFIVVGLNVTYSGYYSKGIFEPVNLFIISIGGLLLGFLSLLILKNVTIVKITDTEISVSWPLLNKKKAMRLDEIIEIKEVEESVNWWEVEHIQITNKKKEKIVIRNYFISNFDSLKECLANISIPK